MVTDLSRLPSTNCPAARAVRLRDRLAVRCGPAWTVADAMVKRSVRIEACAGPVTRKLRPGAGAATESPSVALRAELLPEPEWQDTAEEAKKLADVQEPLLEAMEDTFAAVRPPARIGGRALPSVCLTPRLLPVPAARAF